ncbi:arylsulfatase [Parapedobacter sp. SGR-10]|uniref:sulfatase family protein n=1 Tax=Parapedobacter sp. SGR-10 TaxID=2710879 RepID=UPI0013D515B5|nr:arylsulfatase [Parapedobacter sp. SGR-10]NGF55061.1 arylsulfatase [Parapedobacter sp. SGR-10]
MKIILAFFLLLILCNTAYSHVSKEQKKSNRPNIVIIYLDDLGYGDVSAYGATALKTPHIDLLAKNGIRFTNGRSTSSTCTPSRYAMLTGMYPWRNKEAKILPGDAPLLIDTQQQTLPKILKQADYHTGIVGKWHLGLGKGKIDWNKHIRPGPNEVGFDYSFIMAATQDRVPTVLIENGNVVGLEADDPIEVDYTKNFEGEPTGLNNPELMRIKYHHGHNNSITNGIPRIGFMKGGTKAKWIDEDLADVFLNKAQEYVRQHKNKPFFLYYAMHQPHVPRTPHKRFEGMSGLGPRGDVILEADWCIGEFMKTLEEEGLIENTLIIFSSDNGPVLNDGYYDDAVERLGDHKPWGPFRGGKTSLYEAGTRVPFIVQWKQTIKPGVSDALICQMDLMTSLGKMLNITHEQTDSQNILNALLGKSEKGRNELILESLTKTALLQGDWVMIPPYDGPAVTKTTNIERGNSPEYQLYNIKNDIGQQNNLAKTHPDILKKMIDRHRALVGDPKNVKE